LALHEGMGAILRQMAGRCVPCHAERRMKKDGDLFAFVPRACCEKKLIFPFACEGKCCYDKP